MAYAGQEARLGMPGSNAQRHVRQAGDRPLQPVRRGSARIEMKTNHVYPTRGSYTGSTTGKVVDRREAEAL